MSKKYVTGILEKGKLRPFKVSDFIKTLNELANSDFKTFEQKASEILKTNKISFEDFFTYRQNDITKSIFENMYFQNLPIKTNGWMEMLNDSEKEGEQNFYLMRKVIGYQLNPEKGLDSPIYVNELGIPRTRHTNFYSNKKQMFSWFINDPKTKYFLKDFPENHILINFHYWKDFDDLYDGENQYVDTKIVITRKTFNEETGQIDYEGGIDVNGYLPYFLDHFLLERYVKSVKDLDTKLNRTPEIEYSDLIYLLSPLQVLSELVIADTLKQILSVKRGKASAKLLEDSIAVFFRYLQNIIGDDNKHIQIRSRIRIIPFNGDFQEDFNDFKDLYNTGIRQHDRFYEGSWFFNWFDKQHKSKSWSDALSANLPQALFSKTINDLDLNISFLNEENMNGGLYCVDDIEFRKFLIEQYPDDPILPKYIKDYPVFNIKSVFYMRSHEGLKSRAEIICPLVDENSDLGAFKKAVQRQKIVNSTKYPMNKSRSLLPINELPRNAKYLSPEKEQIFQDEDFATWALVGFYDGDESIKDYSLEEYTNLSPNDLKAFHLSLSGIGCEAWSTEKFSKTIISKANRTDLFHMSSDEISDNMLQILSELDNGREVHLDFKNHNYKRRDTLAYFSVECPDCTHKMLEGDPETKKEMTIKDENGEVLIQGKINPDTEYFYCPRCNLFKANEHKGMINYRKASSIGYTYSLDSLMKPNFIGQDKEGYKSFTIKSYKNVEDGLALKLTYDFPLSNARLTSSISLLKAVPVNRNDEFVGKIKELKVKHGEKEVIFKDVQLDMLLSASSVKGKHIGVMNSNIALVNAVFGETYTINEYIERKDPDFSLKEINEKIIKHVKRVLVEREVPHSFYDEDGNFITEFKKVEQYLYVGLIDVSITEISQEYNKIYSYQKPRKVSLNNQVALDLLGYKKLSEELYKNNLKSFVDGTLSKGKHSASKIDKELLAILQCLSDSLYNNGDYKQSEHYPVILNATQDIRSREGYGIQNELTRTNFIQNHNNRVTIANWVSQLEYQKTISKHPLFNDPAFLDGNYGFFVVTGEKLVKNEKGRYSNMSLELKYCLRFPSKALMESMVNVSNNGFRVQFNEIFSSFLALFEMISTSELRHSKNQDGDPVLYMKGRDNHKVRDNHIKNIVNAIIKYFALKEGEFVERLSMNLPGLGSKQVGDVLIPEDVVIIPNQESFRRIAEYASKDMTEEERNWELSYDENSKEYNLGHSWLEEHVGLILRDPSVWLYQNRPIRIWSRFKANEEFLKLYNRTYEELFPGNQAIIGNSVKMVADQESDQDGDFVTILFNHNRSIDHLFYEYIEECKSDGFFKNDEYYDEILKDPNLSAEKRERIQSIKINAGFSKQARFFYLKDELKGFSEKYPNQLSYDLTNKKMTYFDQRKALLSSAESKKDIGFLTTSMRSMIYTVSYLRGRLMRGDNTYPVINKSMELMIAYVFQYLILQRQGVRAVKANGPYGKLTLDNIIKDKNIIIQQGIDTKTYHSRDLLAQMILEFDRDHGTKFFDLNGKSEVFNKIIEIADNFFISEKGQIGKGGGYTREKTENERGQKVIDIKLEKRRGFYEPLHIDPEYKDFKGLLHLVIGNNPKQFIKNFGEKALFKGLYTQVFSNVPLLKNVSEDLSVLSKK